MCGRFVIDASLEMLVEYFAAMTDLTEWAPTWNAAPTHRLPVLLGGARGRRLGLMRWGWKREFSTNVMVNAIGEEAATKKTFASAMTSQRCLVPATAFYEWREADKQPYAFRLRTKEPFAIGALWERPKDQPDGVFVLLTVAANAVVAPVHHRMAMILDRQHWNLWMDPAVPTDEVTGLITPSAAELWDAIPVSKRVNNVRNNEAGLLDMQKEPGT